MEQLTIKTRPRTPEEATSLGFLIGKKYFFPLWLTTIAAMLPFLLLSLAVVWISHSWTWGVFTLWLGKPYFERPALLVLSRLIFGEKWQFSAVKRDLWHGLRGRLLIFLILRPASRIAQAAVYLLENLSGKDLRQRLKYVQKKTHQVGVTAGFSFLESAFIISLAMFSLSLLPREFSQLSSGQVFSLPWLRPFLYGLIFLAFSVSNVFFVAVGFMDYLNQRIISEGWAIALDMQALLKRLMMIFLLSLAIFCPSSPAVYAQTMTAAKVEDKRFLAEKSRDPSVSPLEERRIPKKHHDNPTPLRFGEMSKAMSGLIRIAVILLVSGGLLWLVLFIWRERRKGNPNTTSPSKNSLSDVEITHQSLQTITNPVQAARDLLQAGQKTAALSLLYRASLQKLTADFAFSMQKGDSDGDCLQNARPIVPERVFSFLEKLIAYWQQAAYGGKPPAGEDIAQCIEEFARLWT